MTSRPGEFELIANYFAPLAGEGTFGFKDDAALIKPKPGYDLVVTQDSCAENIHFFADDPPDLIAKKALRVNLSDLAAKGAKPLGFSLSLGLGNGWDENWIREFARGLSGDIKAFNIALTGGDTFRTGSKAVISITAFGETPIDKYVSRLGAGQGDYVFVSGTLGDAALGLQVRLGKLALSNQSHEDHLRSRYLLPHPRVEMIKILREFASASMDISDGLLADLEKLCSASQVSGNIELPKIPLSEAASACIELDSKWLETVITGGDDYEILFTVPENKIDAFYKTLQDENVTVTKIGYLSSGSGVKSFDANGNPVQFSKRGYDHSGENT